MSKFVFWKKSYITNKDNFFSLNDMHLIKLHIWEKETKVVSLQPTLTALIVHKTCTKLFESLMMNALVLLFMLKYSFLVQIHGEPFPKALIGTIWLDLST